MELVDPAVAIRADVDAGGDVPTTLRLVRQFVMDMGDRERFEQVVAVEPPSTGDERWDAMISGVVEDLAHQRGSAVPAWIVGGS